jgi:hypothetical protein
MFFNNFKEWFILHINPTFLLSLWNDGISWAPELTSDSQQGALPRIAGLVCGNINNKNKQTNSMALSPRANYKHSIYLVVCFTLIHWTQFKKHRICPDPGFWQLLASTMRCPQNDWVSGIIPASEILNNCRKHNIYETRSSSVYRSGRKTIYLVLYKELTSISDSEWYELASDSFRLYSELYCVAPSVPLSWRSARNLPPVYNALSTVFR